MTKAAVKKASDTPGAWQPANMLEQIVYRRFERMFELWNDSKPPRLGVHVSSLIKTAEQFCYRQMVLMQFFPHAKVKLHGKALRIFLQGNVMHDKWQYLFKLAKLAIEIENSRKDEVSEATFTPDAIIKIGNRRFIVEIKSMKGSLYDSMKSVHADAQIQANMYMHLTGERYAIVLVENKDTQDFKLWVIEYDPGLIKPFIVRMHRTKKFMDEYRKNRTLPSKHHKCFMPDTSKARNCPVVDACFAGKLEREKMRKQFEKEKKKVA